MDFSSESSQSVSSHITVISGHQTQLGQWPDQFAARVSVEKRTESWKQESLQDCEEVLLFVCLEGAWDGAEREVPVLVGRDPRADR